MRRTLLVAGALTVLGCGEATDPTLVPYVGSYTALQFTVTEPLGATPVDYIALGATIDLTLNGDGTTEGELFFPDDPEVGGDSRTSLEGTWALGDTSVTLAHEADTFLRDMDFVLASDSSLVAQENFDDQAVFVRLVR